jgi:TonB family protein
MPVLPIVNLLAWSLQVLLVVMVAALVARLMPVDSAAVRHTWWRVVLVMCLALPLLQPWRYTAVPVATPSIAADMPIDGGSPATAGRDSAPHTFGFRFSLPSWPVLVVIALVSGAALRLAWLTGGLVRLRRLRRTGATAPECPANHEVQTLLRARAEIRYVDAVGQPVTFGFLRPIVLLPASLRALPPDQQRAVLAHELWHVRRSDWAWVIAEETLRAVLWFHPAIWWLISRVQSSREEVVDELTVLLTSSRRSYLDALLAFADKPPLFPAAPFMRRRELFNRMVLISKEAVMSSRRIVASCAGMLVVLVLAGWYGAAAFPLTAEPTPHAVQVQSPARDTRPGEAKPATAREVELARALADGALDASGSMELAKLQEQRGAAAEAEATLLALRHAQPGNGGAYHALAALYARMGQFDRAVGTLEEAAALDASNPKGHQIVAEYYHEKATKDHTLGPTERMTYLRQGLAAADRALAAQSDFVAALIYKNLLLRAQAGVETDASKRQALLSEADQLRRRALELRAANGAEMRFVPRGDGPAPPPPPPPPPPPDGTDAARLIDGRAPIRVGGNIGPPTKIRDVRPEYPAQAQAAGVQGVIILEATIDQSGAVRSARVLRSIPLLDQAAVDAVQQWRFTPTLLNGEAVPVIMTVTVNFTLQQEIP